MSNYALISPSVKCLTQRKQLYVPPVIELINISDIVLNNSSGSGDGDAALAHS